MENKELKVVAEVKDNETTVVAEEKPSFMQKAKDFGKKHGKKVGKVLLFGGALFGAFVLGKKAGNSGDNYGYDDYPEASYDYEPEEVTNSEEI